MEVNILFASWCEARQNGDKAQTYLFHIEVIDWIYCCLEQFVTKELEALKMIVKAQLMQQTKL